MNEKDIEAGSVVASGRGVKALARPRSLDEKTIGRLMDSGLAGLLFAAIETPTEVEAVIQAVQHHPRGSRGFSPFVRAYGFGSSTEFVAREAPEIIVGIESAEASVACEALLSFPEVTGVFVGLFDMSVSLGVPGQTQHPSVREAFSEVSRVAKKLNKSVWTIAVGKDAADIYRGLGATHLLVSVDAGVISQAYRQRIEEASG